MANSSWLICFTQNYGPLITGGAILLSAGVAAYAIIYNSWASRKRATIDLVMHHRQDKELIKAKKLFHKLHVDGTEFSKYSLKENSETDEYNLIITVLNAYEFVAVGIKNGAFHENIYKQMQWSVLVRDWGLLEIFVKKFRKSR